MTIYHQMLNNVNNKHQLLNTGNSKNIDIQFTHGDFCEFVAHFKSLLYTTRRELEQQISVCSGWRF